MKSRGLSPLGVSSPVGTGWIKWLDSVAPSAIANITVIAIVMVIFINYSNRNSNSNGDGDGDICLSFYDHIRDKLR